MPNLYIPNKWVALEISTDNETVIRLLSGWYGGYLGSDSWRLSTNVASVIEKISDSKSYDSYYEITTETGSVYHCGKHNYGLSRYTADIYEQLIEQQKNTKVRILEEVAYVFSKPLH